MTDDSTTSAKEAAMPDDLVERVDPTSVALVLRQCVITFGGVEQTKLGERAHDVVTQLEAENARLRGALETISSQAICCGMSATETELRDWLLNIFTWAEDALATPALALASACLRALTKEDQTDAD